MDELLKEIYTLEQLRKMNKLNGDKRLIFVPQLEKAVKRLKKEINKWTLFKSNQDIDCIHTDTLLEIIDQTLNTQTQTKR